MRTKSLFSPLLAVLCFLWGASFLVPSAAANVIPEPVFTAKTVALESNCDLDAPNKLHITSIKGPAISAAWDAVSGAAEYQMELYVSGTNILVASRAVKATSGTINAGQPGFYDLYVSAVAPGCRPSSKRSRIEKLGVIIAELTLDFSPKASGRPIFDRPASGGCFTMPFTTSENDFPEYGFSIVNTQENGMQNPSAYSIDILCLNFCYPELKIGRNTPLFKSLQTYPLGFNGSIWSPPVVPDVNEIRIFDYQPVPGEPNNDYLYAVTIEKIEMSGSPMLKVCFCPNSPWSDPYGINFTSTLSGNEVSFDPDCGAEFASAPAENIGATPAGRASGNDGTVHMPETIVQNPFQESLTIQSSYTGDTHVALRLFDMNGNLVATQTGPAAQEYTLNTAQLPAAMYLLRIEIPGLCQTYKVVKL